MLFNINLFSSFDLNSFFIRFYFLIFIFIFNLIKLIKFNFNILYFYYFLNLFINIIFSSLKPDFEKKMFKMINIKMFLRLFYFIYFINIFSLSFFSFSFTGIFFYNFRIVLILWLGRILKYIKKISSFFEHLCPLGCPLILSFFIVLIETARIIIQPIAIILRLTINIISGHIIISLFSIIIIEGILYSISISLIFFPFLIIKFFICGIQRYIISILISICYNH